jgi:hypothetical protein
MASSGQIGEDFSAKYKPNLLYFAFIFSFQNAKSKDLATSQIYRNFRFKTKPRYLLYTVLCIVLSRSAMFSDVCYLVPNVSVGKTYSFAIFGVALGGANCKCVWLSALAIFSLSFNMLLYLLHFEVKLSTTLI